MADMLLWLRSSALLRLGPVTFKLEKSEEMDFCMAIENNSSLVSLNKNLFIFAYVCDVCLYEWYTHVLRSMGMCACGGWHWMFSLVALHLVY